MTNDAGLNQSKVLRRPCSDCPFSRASPPGGTGGAPPEVFIGQAIGPFFLPCHQSPGYDEDRRSPTHRQCAGAAIYRANIGVADTLPEQLHRLPADTGDVFASAAEFFAHHREWPLELAEQLLSVVPPELLLAVELKQIGVARVQFPDNVG